MRSLLVSSPVGIMARLIVPLSIVSLCAVLLAQHITVEDLLSLPARLGDIAPWRWGVAAALTLCSFCAIAQYDVLAHCALGTGIAPQRARISGAASMALGQLLGLAVITSGLARWRILSDLNITQAASVSAFVSGTFVLCWGVVTAIICLVLPAPNWTFWPALAVMSAVPIAAVILFYGKVISVFRAKVQLPSLYISKAILFWTFVDLGLAAGALFVLLPPAILDFTTFLPLFLIALGCGLIANTPGGVGPFELTLLSAVPLTDPAPIVAAIVGFRIVYYAVPAIVAAIALLRPFAKTHPLKAPHCLKPTNAARSEVAVVAQNGGALARLGTSTLAFWPTAQTLTLFTDPVTGSSRTALTHLRRAAQAAGKVAMVYKCSKPLAHAARSTGWAVLHIADEAMVNVRTFDIDVPARRSLRRKLRTAVKGGVTLRTGHPLPHAAMARIDAEWQSAHGTARGGSMGRYCPHYVAQQWVACAYLDNQLVAFVTAHRGSDEWCLDIMRHGAELPDGTMHKLVLAAIEAAKQAGARRFSLAATPACPNPDSAFWRWAAEKVVAKSGGRGLRQFKSNFAPDWAPRYAAAPSWWSLALGLADIARTIRNPGELVRPDTNEIHKGDENYEVASVTAA